VARRKILSPGCGSANLPITPENGLKSSFGKKPDFWTSSADDPKGLPERFQRPPVATSAKTPFLGSQSGHIRSGGSLIGQQERTFKKTKDSTKLNNLYQNWSSLSRWNLFLRFFPEIS
jgi:hypothetical protein